MKNDKLDGKIAVVTGALAKELGPRKIRVNAIRPGMVITDRVITAGFHKAICEPLWNRKRRSIESVGRTILRLPPYSSPHDSKWVTGNAAYRTWSPLTSA